VTVQIADSANGFDHDLKFTRRSFQRNYLPKAIKFVLPDM
jgi:hypothetical protein